MIWWLVGIPACVYVGFGAVLWLMQGRMVYFPTRELTGTPGDLGLAFEEVSFRAADGVRLHGWFVPAGGDRGVVLFCHGNGGNISGRLPTIQLLHGLGLSTFIFDYRGYGRSEGSPTEAGTYLDAEAAWDWLLGRGFRAERVVVFGRSLGGSIAAHLAADRDPAALIVESTLTSAADLAARLYPVYPVRLMLRYKYDTLAAIRRLRCPVLVAHSPGDELIPYAHGQRLFAAAPEPRQFLEMTGGHNDGHFLTGRAYVDAIDAFLTGHLGGSR